METEWDRRVLFTLSQIIYKDYEEPDETLLEVEFAFPKSADVVKLLWHQRQPVGFYSVKPKGIKLFCDDLQLLVDDYAILY
jgi:hypothetical protein